jgi:hypothetical protein
MLSATGTRGSLTIPHSIASLISPPPDLPAISLSDYAVNGGPANSGLETVLRLRRTGPQLSLVLGSRPSFRSP